MRALDLSGQRFSRLVAVERVASSKNGAIWYCICDCGEEVNATVPNLRSGNTKSCGCLKSEVTAARNRDGATHGMTGAPEFISWDAMKQRCTNPAHKSFKNYGGRGIKVCDRWLESFEHFYADMGNRPAGTTLERDEVDGNYEPGNCKWVTYKEQGNNRRNNRALTLEGVTMTMAEWAEKLSMSRQALRYRVENGWSEKDILKMQVNHGNRHNRGGEA